MLRIYIISAILGLAIAGSAFVFQNSLLTQEESAISKNQPENLNSLLSGKPFVEQLKVKNPDNLANLEENLTENLTKSLAEQITLNNPTGAQLIDGRQAIAVPDTDQIATDLFVEAYQKMNLSELMPEIKNGDLKIIENSWEALTAYAKVFDEINGAIELLEPKNPTELNSQIQDLIQSYEQNIDILYRTPVPKLFTDIQKARIAYLSAELKLLEKMKYMQQDPVSAILASKNFSEMEKKFQEELMAQIFEIFEYIKSAN